MLEIFDLTGRVALVTGATRGLGRAMAEGLARAGADCALAGKGGASWAERGVERASRSLQRPSKQPEETCEEESTSAAANVCAAWGSAGVAPILADLECADAFELDTRLRRAVARCTVPLTMSPD